MADMRCQKPEISDLRHHNSTFMWMGLVSECMPRATVEYDWERRIERVREQMLADGFDGLYVPAGPNQFYLTGYSGYDGGWPIWLNAFILPAEGDPRFILTEMDEDIFQHATTWIDDDLVVTYMDGEDPTALLSEIFTELELTNGRIGLQDETWFGDTRLIRDAAPGVTLESAQHIFDRVRAVKDEREIENIRRATEMAGDVFERLTEAVWEGRPVTEAAEEIGGAMLGAGSERVGGLGESFDNPDGHFEDGEIVNLDIGPQHKYYTTDCGRVFFVGSPDPAHEDLYRLMNECFEATLEIVEPGVTCHEVHTFAESYLAERGHDLPWKIGHGIGLMGGHEAPLVQANNHTELEPGMVIVIDPGTHIDGFDRDVPIHVESPVVVTEDGAENLSPFTHDVITL